LDDGAKSEFFPFAPDASGSLDMSFNTSFAGLMQHHRQGAEPEGVLKKWGAAADIAEAERLVGGLSPVGFPFCLSPAAPPFFSAVFALNAAHPPPPLPFDHDDRPILLIVIRNSRPWSG
jgi:hypothetical protein